MSLIDCATTTSTWQWRLSYVLGGGKDALSTNHNQRAPHSKTNEGGAHQYDDKPQRHSNKTSNKFHEILNKT